MSLPTRCAAGIEWLESRFLLSTQTFTNAGAIGINADYYPPTAASPYPAGINVSGLSGSVDKVTVKLNGFTHSRPEDVDVLLVGPQGQSVMLISDAGYNNPVSNKTLTFDDSGSAVPQYSQINTATYRPTDYETGDDFPSPAPYGAPSDTHLWTFNGVDPNGTWSLYVVNDFALSSAGSIGGGWSLTISTAAAAPPAPSTPYLASDSGVSSNDNITRITTPTFTGTAEPSSTVRILADDVQVGTATASSGGAYSVTTSALADGIRSITATATNAGGTSNPSAALSITIDTVAPTILANSFGWQTRHALVYDFSENVGPTLSDDDLRVENLTSGYQVPADPMSFSYDTPTNHLTATFPGLVNQILPDGNYRATVSASGVTDLAGNPLPDYHVSSFFVLVGDANHDRIVDITDLGILATNWQGSPRTFSQGDFNYDTKVDISDLGILATKWQTGVTALSLASPGRLTRHATFRVIDLVAELQPAV